VDTSRAVFETPRITRRTPALGASIDVDVTGAKKLFLVAEDANGGTEGDDIVWSEPTILTATGSQRLTAQKWVSATSGLGTASTEHGAKGGDLWVAGKPPRFGIGAHPQSVIEYDLPKDATQFLAFAGIDERGADPTHGYGAGVRFLVFTKSPFATAPSAPVPVNLSQLGIKGAAQIRDLWHGQDLGRVTGKFSPDIRAHGAGLYRISPSN
jgi:alpha-galactosidase